MGEVLILDSEETWTHAAHRLRQLGYRPIVLPPASDVTGDADYRRVTGVAVNLAIPSVWDAAHHFRSRPGGAATPFVAYALTPGASRGCWFGRADFFTPGANGPTLIAMLTHLNPAVQRVLVVGGLDGITDVRDQLDRAHIATASVLDAHQLRDLFPVVHPDVAIVHLSPHCFDVFPAIRRLRATEQGSDIPLLFLVRAEAHSRDVAFFSAGVRTLSEHGNLEAGDLAERLVSALAAR